MPFTRRLSRAVTVGPVVIGGGAPVSIQSMTSVKTSDIAATLAQIRELAAAGCELVRVAVPDELSAGALPELLARSPLPLIADIHFDYRLAVTALEKGVTKVRINPGNIGGRDKFLKVLEKAAVQGAAVRIGVNAGSLERKVQNRHGGATAQALVESALGYLKWVEETGFANVVVSLKASEVPVTIQAYREIASRTDYPLHLGVTEAGLLESGTIKNCLGIGTLLAEGIGDTIRVSLTADPVAEVRVARLILQFLRLREFGPELVACPTCGRCEINLVPLAEEVAALLKQYTLPLKVAVMGCTVNGPGESREADLGICGGKNHGLIFRKGKLVRRVERDHIIDALQEELEKLSREWCK